jgi:hypothetical protein
VKEGEAPENVEARLVTRTGFIGHTLHFGENIPATGSYPDGNLELGYHQDQGFTAAFPLLE